MAVTRQAVVANDNYFLLEVLLTSIHWIDYVEEMSVKY